MDTDNFYKEKKVNLEKATYHFLPPLATFLQLNKESRGETGEAEANEPTSERKACTPGLSESVLRTRQVKTLATRKSTGFNLLLRGEKESSIESEVPSLVF